MANSNNQGVVRQGVQRTGSGVAQQTWSRRPKAGQTSQFSVKRTFHQSHVVQTPGEGTVAGTFTADAWIAGPRYGSFALNAVIGWTQTFGNPPVSDWQHQVVGAGDFTGVAYGNGYWVAVGVTGKLYYSDNNGATWTSNTQGSTNFHAVAYGGGYWVAVGLSGVLYYATDPTGAWTSNNQGSAELWRVAYGNGYWVAVGVSGTLYYSTTPVGAWTSNNQGAGDLYGVVYGGGYWVTVGAAGSVYYKATNPTGAWTSNPQGGEARGSVAYGDGYWFAAAWEFGDHRYTTDPTGAWTSASDGFVWQFVAYGGGYWMKGTYSEWNYYRAGDPTGVFTAHRKQLGALNYLAGAYGDGHWLIVGSRIGTNGVTADAILKATQASSFALDAIHLRTSGVYVGPATRDPAAGQWPLGTVNFVAAAQRVVLAAGEWTFEYWLSKNSSPTDNLVTTVRANTASLPGAVIATIGTVAGSSLTTSPTRVLSDPVLLPAGTYWVSFARSGAPDNSHNYGLAQGLEDYQAKAAFNGSTWTNFGNPPLFVVGRAPLNVTVDAIALRAQTSSFTLNAVIKRTQASSFTVDAYIPVPPVTGSFTADAVLKRTQSSSFSLDAVIKANVVGIIDRVPSFVQMVGTLGTPVGYPSTPQDVPVVVNTTAGNHLVLNIACNHTTGFSVADSRGNTWQRDLVQLGTFTTIQVWSCRMTTALLNGDVITITTGGSASIGASVAEYTGVAPRAWLDRGSTGTGDGTLTDSGATPPTRQANELLVGAASIYGTSNTYTPEVLSPVWVKTTQIKSTQASNIMPAYRVVAAVGAYSAKWTLTSSVNWTGAIAAYRGGADILLDAVLLKTQASSFGLDAVLAKETTGSFPVDAILLSTRTASFSLDAVLVAGQTGTFTLDALLVLTVAGSFPADAVLKATVVGSFGLDAVLVAERMGSFTLDANLAIIHFGSLTADAVLAATPAATTTLDAVLATTRTGSFGLDAVILRTRGGDPTSVATASYPITSATSLAIPGGATANNHDYATLFFDFSADPGTITPPSGWALQASSTGSRAYLYIQSNASVVPTPGSFTWVNSVSGAAVVTVYRGLLGNAGPSGTGEPSASPFTSGGISLPFDTGRRFFVMFFAAANGNSTFTPTAPVQTGGSLSTANSSVWSGYSTRYVNPVAQSLSLTVSPTATGFVTYFSRAAKFVFGADAVLKRTQTGTFALDAVKGKAQASSFSLNASIAITRTGSFKLDAFILGPTISSFTANAVKKRSQLGSTSLDAFLSGAGAGSFTLDAYLIERRTGSFTADAFILATRAGSFSVAAVVKATASASIPADAVIRWTVPGLFALDSVTKTVFQAGLTVDAIVLSARTDGFAAQAVLLSPQEAAFTVDAAIRGLIPDHASATFSAATASSRMTAATVEATMSARTIAWTTVEAYGPVRRTSSLTLEAEIA